MNQKNERKDGNDLIIDFKFPPDIADKGNEMTWCYFKLYCLENFLRLFTENVAINNLGIKYWELLKIKKEILEKIKSRKEKEEQNRWLSLRGNSNIFYMDFDDIRRLIISNWNLFATYFPDQPWITQRLTDLYKIRNLIAHNSYIDRNDQKTLDTFANNIYNQLVKTMKIQFPYQYIIKKDESYSRNKDLFIEFQKLIYTQDFKKIIAQWHRFKRLFMSELFMGKLYSHYGSGILSIRYYLDKSGLEITYEKDIYTCTITNSKEITVKNTDKDFNSMAKEFFDNIADSIGIF